MNFTAEWITRHVKRPIYYIVLWVSHVEIYAAALRPGAISAKRFLFAHVPLSGRPFGVVTSNNAQGTLYTSLNSRAPAHSRWLRDFFREIFESWEFSQRAKIKRKSQSQCLRCRSIHQKSAFVERFGLRISKCKLFTRAARGELNQKDNYFCAKSVRQSFVPEKIRRSLLVSCSSSALEKFKEPLLRLTINKAAGSNGLKEETSRQWTKSVSLREAFLFQTKVLNWELRPITMAEPQ